MLQKKEEELYIDTKNVFVLGLVSQIKKSMAFLRKIDWCQQLILTPVRNGLYIPSKDTCKNLANSAA